MDLMEAWCQMKEFEAEVPGLLSWTFWVESPVVRDKEELSVKQ